MTETVVRLCINVLLNPIVFNEFRQFYAKSILNINSDILIQLAVFLLILRRSATKKRY